ncbi:MAG TPA: DciA family protein [Gemmatimonadales bacterium]|nr:DciA family protein [Gemmatimonadales bacterium]
MPAALTSVLRRAPLTPEKVAFAWRTAVGAALDRATGVELRGATLVVAVRNDEWRHELARSLPLIHSRVNLVLGDGVVARIDLQSERT